MERSYSWEAKGHFTGQKLFYLVYNSRIHRRVHKSTQMNLILGHMNPLHISFCLFNINFNIIVSSTPMSPKLPLLFLFSAKCLYVLSMPSLYAPYASHLTRLDLTIVTVLVKRTNHETPHCVIFSMLLLLFLQFKYSPQHFAPE
jgi:hypothetical protein